VTGHAVRARAVRTSVLGLCTAAVLILLAACASSGHDTTSATAPGTQPARATASPNPATPSGQVAPAHATATVRHVFAAFGPGGAPTAGVEAHRSGSCFTASITVDDPVAYRCFAANTILDPCFAAARTASTVYCYATPWSRATALRLTKPLPTASVLPVTRPWAIELPGNNRCVVVTGTTTVVRGVPLGYRCQPGSAGLTTSTAGSATRHALYRAPGGTLRQVPVLAEWSA
jgi:hypothetical protein